MSKERSYGWLGVLLVAAVAAGALSMRRSEGTKTRTSSNLPVDPSSGDYIEKSILAQPSNIQADNTQTTTKTSTGLDTLEPAVEYRTFLRF